MEGPEVRISIVDSVWCKQMHFLKSGDNMYGHKHMHDHMTLLAKGKLEVSVGDIKKNFTAPQIILILKDEEHTLTALEDNTVAYCIHALRDYEDGDIIDEETRVSEPITKP